MWPFSRRSGTPSFADIDPSEAYGRVRRGELLIDVRQPGELRQGRFPKAVHVPLAELEAYAAKLDPEAPVMLVCRSGNRSRTAARRLAGRGFTRVSNVRGGLNGWRRAGLPLKGAGRR